MSGRTKSVALALLLTALPARGADPAPTLTPVGDRPLLTIDRTDETGVFSGGRMVVTTAHVRSVDLAGRKVTLHGSGGKVQTFQVGPEVKLERIDVGDRVNLRYREGLVLRVQDPGSADVAPDVERKVQKDGIGDVLSGTEVVRARETLAVTGIDAGDRAVTFRGTDGQTYRVKVAADVPLERVKVGDRFTATYSSAMAVAVEPVYPAQ